MFPRYSYPARFVLGLVRDGLLKRRRRFADDARLCTARLRPPLRVIGAGCIPEHGGYVITVNHYFRPGFASQWSAFAISSAIPADVHWIMTGELTFPGRWIAPLGMPASRFALGRFARVYGFTAMPPMPPRQRDVEARTAAVRGVLRYVRQAERPVVAIAPEGGDQPGGLLNMPPAGVGRFCTLLAAAGLRLLPTGVYEQDGALTVRFGEAYELQVNVRGSAEDRDRAAAFEVMNHIAPLLPPQLRGEFSGTRPV